MKTGQKTVTFFQVKDNFSADRDRIGVTLNSKYALPIRLMLFGKRKRDKFSAVGVKRSTNSSLWRIFLANGSQHRVGIGRDARSRAW